MLKQPTQKADQVYELLRHSIIMLEIQPGAPIVEKDICAELSVSRTPVREAVQKLAEEGLDNVIPHSGTYVSHISFQVAEEGFVIRRALEIESVRRAAQRFDEAGGRELDALVGRMRGLIETGQLERYLDEDDALHAKIALVIAISVVHGYLSGAVRKFASDRNEKSARHWRVVNEVPTLLMIAIVILVIVKPF